MTKQVLQAALEAEMSEHLGYEKGHSGGRAGLNVRNGSSPKTVRTEVGAIELQIPRDREGSFSPAIVPRHSRRLAGFDQAVISLYAKGLTTGEIQAHLEQVYDVEVSSPLVSRVTEKVAEELEAWRSRPLDAIYAVVFIDCIYVKIREGSAAKGPVYVAVGVNLLGDREVLGLWAGTGGEGGKHWLSVLAELAARGVEDVLILCCDGVEGPARRGRGGVAEDHGADLRGPLDARQPQGIEEVCDYPVWERDGRWHRQPSRRACVVEQIRVMGRDVCELISVRESVGHRGIDTRVLTHEGRRLRST